jgi:ketosteroid isomerase-like protein
MKSRVIWLCALALLMLVLPFSLLAGYLKIGETPESVLQAVIRANSEKDLGALEKYMAKDPDVVVYTIGGRKYVGWNELAKAMQEEFDAADRLDVTITDIHVWQHGDVAWFAMELNYNRLEGNEEGQKPMVLPLRDTGVLERRNGRWLLVSWHESLQAPAVEAETASDTQASSVANSIDLNGDWEVQEEDRTYRAHLDLRGNGTYTWQGGRITTTGFAGQRWMGTWQQPGNDREGKFEIVLSQDGAGASGRWWYTRVGTRTNIPPGIGGSYHWKRLFPVPTPSQAAR